MKAALIPNLAIVMYRGIMEMSFGKIKRKNVPTMERENAAVNDFLGPTDEQTKTLTKVAEPSASCATMVFYVMVPLTFFI